jgi:major membrane immunogen (membrane-anchored lipoprotein)
MFSRAPLCLVAILAGCGRDDGRVPVYPAKGKVTVSGEVPEGALVVLYPAKKGSGAEVELRPSGRVKPDGTFSLTTYDAEDGAPAGEYAATIQWNKLIKQGQDYKAGPNIIPAAYAAPESSPWKIAVAESPNDLAPLDIKK